jgi:hypothetical protein
MRQSGQTLVVFTITMLFVFVGLVVLIGDAEVLMARYERASLTALIAAQTGASQVDLAALYNPAGAIFRLDPTAAQQQCQQAVRQQLPGAAVSCQVPPPYEEVTATVTDPVSLPIPLFAPSVTVTVSRTAEAVFGGQSPQ